MTSPRASDALRLVSLRKVYGPADNPVTALDGVSLSLPMVTHDPVAAAYADDVIFLADGRLAGRLANPTAEAVAERMTHLGDDVAQRAPAA
jgi:ABC-type hemin transport system ATPase subunit